MVTKDDELVNKLEVNRGTWSVTVDAVAKQVWDELPWNARVRFLTELDEEASGKPVENQRQQDVFGNW